MRTRIIVFSLLMTGWLGHSRADDPLITGSISGRVVTIDGKPIPRAAVWCQDRQDVLLKTESDEQGRFQLGPIAVFKKTPTLTYPNRLTVWAETSELARDRIDQVAIFPGKTHDIGDLTLGAGTEITGRAVDQNGKPLTGASITIESHRYILGHTIDTNGPDWKLTTGADGVFATPPLPAGSVTIQLKASGRASTTTRKHVDARLGRVELGDLTLEPEVATAGIVVDKKSGKGVPEVSVFADYGYANAVTTDTEGRFQLKGLGGDAKTITLNSKSHFAPQPLPIEGDRLNLKLPIQQAFQIKGKVVDAETGELIDIAHAQLCQVRKGLDGATVLQG